MTTDDHTDSDNTARRRRMLPVGVALAIATLLAIASLITLQHQPGVPTLTAGQKGNGHAIAMP